MPFGCELIFFLISNGKFYNIKNKNKKAYGTPKYIGNIQWETPN
jgi:hypothetical protein